jgi:signal transduction histidine kinase
VGEAYIDAAIERGIGMELVPARKEVLVAGQADLLREALGNLIDNAIRYTPSGGRVEIAITDDPPSISVLDSGPGIPPEERGKVFERFVRGEGTVGAGSGLGLSIVKEIASLHGAEVRLDAGAERGARFMLRFPAPKRPARA